MLDVRRYSRSSFEEAMSDINDSNVELLNEYFICINATGWIHGIPYFKKEHRNVINLYFDDVHKTGLKVIPWFNNDQRIIYAHACSKEQAVELKKFIETIPQGSIVHIYCAKGRSRSRGVEMYISELFNNTVLHDEINSNVYDMLKSV
jgi:hypothetical protein